VIPNSFSDKLSDEAGIPDDFSGKLSGEARIPDSSGKPSGEVEIPDNVSDMLLGIPASPDNLLEKLWLHLTASREAMASPDSLLEKPSVLDFNSAFFDLSAL
jgi:hypothetical protein